MGLAQNAEFITRRQQDRFKLGRASLAARKTTRQSVAGAPAS
jgi:hypothetical protein